MASIRIYVEPIIEVQAIIHLDFLSYRHFDHDHHLLVAPFITMTYREMPGQNDRTVLLLNIELNFFGDITGRSRIDAAAKFYFIQVETAVTTFHNVDADSFQ